MDEIKEQLNIAYNKYATHISKSIMEQWRVKTRKDICDILKKYKVNTMLDMGCGCGMDSQFFMNQGFKVKGIDLSDRLINICKKKNIDAEKMDFFNLELLSEKFDCVYAQNSLLHVPKKDFECILSKIHHQVKKNGIVYIGMFGGIDREGVYDKDFFNPKRFFNSYTDQNIIDLVSKQFKVLSFERKDLENNDFHHQSIFLQKVGEI